MVLVGQAVTHRRGAVCHKLNRTHELVGGFGYADPRHNSSRSAIACCKLICAKSSTALATVQNGVPAAPDFGVPFAPPASSSICGIRAKIAKARYFAKVRHFARKYSCAIGPPSPGRGVSWLHRCGALSTPIGALIFATNDQTKYTTVEAALDFEGASPMRTGRFVLQASSKRAR